MRKYKLQLNGIPLLNKNDIFAFDDDTGEVWRIYENGESASYPLRKELSGYLWLLLTHEDYFTRIL